MTRYLLNGLAITLAGWCLLFSTGLGRADSTSERLAAYYDVKMLLCGETAYRWRGRETPQLVARNAAQVGVGRRANYVLTTEGRLLAWQDEAGKKRELLSGIAWFAAGRTGVFAARPDGTLVYLERSKNWFSEGKLARPIQVGTSVVAASIGDSANYFVTKEGALFVKGLAHRGQYGDGKLKGSEAFIPVARDVTAVKAHTGHAILLTREGRVMGTGGNIYGPLGKHGIGDKAISWGQIFEGAKAIATGSSHSLAIGQNGSLWHWGRDIGLDPKKVLDNVVAAAADQEGSMALLKDNSLWQWARGQQPKQHFQCP